MPVNEHCLQEKVHCAQAKTNSADERHKNVLNAFTCLGTHVRNSRSSN